MMNFPITNLTRNIEENIINFFNEYQKSIEIMTKENQILNEKVKDLEYKLKLSEMKKENLQLKLEMSQSKEAPRAGDISKSMRSFTSKRLFQNFESSPQVIKEKVLVPDTCTFDDLTKYEIDLTQCNLSPVLSTIYESQTGMNVHSPRYLQIKEDCIHMTNSQMDPDETVLEQNDSDIENQETQLDDPLSPISSRSPAKPFKYKGPVVRKKEERKALNGFDCFECREYYAGIGETDSEIEARIQKCSKHRALFAPPSTPEGFWDIGIPDVPIKKGQKIPLTSRRTRQLQMPAREWKQ